MKKRTEGTNHKKSKSLINRCFLTRGGSRRLLSIGVSALLFVSTFLASILQTETIVYADNVKEITGLCTGAIGNPASGAGGWSYVYYGTYGGNAMKYRVLDIDATQFGGNTMLLDCNSTLLTHRFDDDSNVWANSEIKVWLNGDDFLGDEDNPQGAFTLQERAAIASSTKASAATNDGNGWNLLDYAPLEREKIFLLDAKEATRPSYGYANTDNSDSNRSKTGADTWWWLRSPSSNDNDAGDVVPSGDISKAIVSIDEIGVSPAFNLNLESVIFSSVISGNPGDIGAEYKLTIADAGLGIIPGTITRNGTTITVPYTITGANAASANQVSVLITDSEYSAGTASDSGYTYLKLSGGVSGSGTFTLPAEYADETCGADYHAYILVETVNNSNATDYACTPVEITIPDAVATPTFSPAAGTYTEAQNVTISCNTAGATIHYTTDGSAPTAASTTYNGPINIRETKTIKAIAVKDGMTDSSVASARYTISDTPVDTCTITFEPNGGKGDMDDQTVDKGVRTQLNKNKFTRSGYSFDGWNTDPDGDGTGYEDKDYITVQKNITLYAQWERDDHEDDDEDEDDHTPASWILNPNEKQQLSIIFTGTPEGTCAGYQEQGAAAKAVFAAATPRGWSEAFEFNLLNKNRQPEMTLKKGTITLTIPSEYRKAGRQFALIALTKGGQTILLPDTDTNPNTVTATINVEGYAFALIYKDYSVSGGRTF